jgi:hypothetical protein
VKRYPESALWDEVVFLAYHLHWPLSELLDLAHRDRVRMINIVAELNRRSIETLSGA